MYSLRCSNKDKHLGRSKEEMAVREGRGQEEGNEVQGHKISDRKTGEEYLFEIS